MEDDSLFIRSKLPSNKEERVWTAWDIVSTAFMYKNSKRKKEMKKEYILGYLKAAKTIREEIEKDNHFHNKNGERITINFVEDNTCAPFLFLVRHAIELSLKYKLGQRRIAYEPNHTLKYLWNLANQNCNISNETYNDLIDSLNCTDENGYGFRYTLTKGGKEYIEKPLFVHSSNIMKWSEKLIKELLEDKK